MIILLLEPDEHTRRSVSFFLSGYPHTVLGADTLANALAAAGRSAVDVAILDFKSLGPSPEKSFTALRRCIPDSPLLVTGFAKDAASIITAYTYQVYQFIQKPLQVSQLAEVLAEITRQPEPGRDEEPAVTGNSEPLIDLGSVDYRSRSAAIDQGQRPAVICSDAMRTLYRKLDHIKNYSQLPVLIEGESGVGKEHVAWYLHATARGKDRESFVAINCSTLPRDIFEAELFGYTGGAFTGARKEGSPGKIAQAAGGTLFLDEISEIPLELQAKLLRVLQEREYYRIGGSAVQPVNAHIVCATNRKLSSYVQRGLFREDLYYRLSGCHLRVPPLRERPEALLPLVAFFTREMNSRYGKKVNAIERSALHMLQAYSWPGNVRELKNCIMQMLLFQSGNTINCEAVRLAFEELGAGKKTTVSGDGGPACLQPLTETEFLLPDKGLDLETLIDNIITSTLQRFDGNKSKAARYLGINRTQLYHRYKTEK